MDIVKIPLLTATNINVGPISPSTYGNCKCWYPLIAKSILKHQIQGNYSKYLIPSFSPNSYLGTIIHKLFEERVNGSIPDEETYCQRWEELINSTESEIKKAYPLVSNFDLTDYDKMYTSCDSAMRLTPISHLSDTSSRTVSKSTELKVSYDNLIYGSIDRVKRINGKVELIDYKSGQILDESSCIKKQYVSQLNIYAICYEKLYSETVSKLTIIHTDTLEEYNVELQRDKFNVIIHDIKNQLNYLDALVANNTIDTCQVLNDGCGFCSYRHFCKKYMFSPNRDPYMVDGIVTQYGENGTIQMINSTGKLFSISKMKGLTASDGSGIVGKHLIIINVSQPIEGTYKRTDHTIIFEK